MSGMSGSGSGIADSLNGVEMSSLKEVVMGWCRRSWEVRLKKF
jgi:hypothetical protein